MSGLICDLFTTHNNILVKLSEQKYLDLLFKFISEKVILRRKGLLVLRIFHFLYVNKKEYMLKLTVENNTISNLIQNLNDYVADFIINTLEVEKQYITEKNIPQFLLENIDLSSLFIQVIEKDPNVLSIVTSLLSGISNIRGITSDVIKKVLSANSGSFVRYIIDLLKKPEVTSDAVQMLLEFVFPVIDQIEDDNAFNDIINSVLISFKDSFLKLIKSDSSLHCFYGVQLYTAITGHSQYLLEKELLWECIDLMFRFPFSSALHCLISNTIVDIFKTNVVDLVDMLLDNKEKMIDRIINEYSTKDNSKRDFYPHLENIIKSIVNNESSNNKLQQYQLWTQFIDQSWNKMNTLPGNSQIYQPNEEVMRAKEKQLMGVRAGRFTPS